MCNSTKNQITLPPEQKAIRDNCYHTGKLDGRSLPEVDNQRVDHEIAISAPRTPIEKILADIWAEVLLLPKVGINDHFLDLGGHSLAASQLISRVIQTFQLDLSLKGLFDAPTVAAMAIIITQHQANRVSEAELLQMMHEIEAMTEIEAQTQLTLTDDE